MVFSALHFVLKSQYFSQKWLFVACCVQWWSLETPYAATQHARDSPRVNVFWAVSTHKVLPYHRIGQLQALTPWCDGSRMMSHFGKDDSITFFFKQNGPVSQFLSMWQNFSTVIYQRDKVTDRQANSGALGTWIWFDLSFFGGGIHQQTVHAPSASEVWYTQNLHFRWL